MSNVLLRHVRPYRAYRDQLKKQSSVPSCQLSYNSYVGVEIEAEGVDAAYIREAVAGGADQYWDIVRDGSLRGPNFEAVFRNPLAGFHVQKALRMIQEALEPREGRLELGPRTSVHVHVNMHDMPIEKINLMLCLYLIFEEALFNFAGPHRKNSNYCTRMVEDDTTALVIQTLHKREHLEQMLEELKP